jgi:uncharacterized damage-inducible protein DinB
MRILLMCVLATSVIAMAQDSAPKTAPAATGQAQAAPDAAQENPYSAFNKRSFANLKNWVMGSAEKMPEENYNFKPAETVRSYGQLLGHVADAQFLFCSSALGEKNPAPNYEKTKTSKADLIAALKDGFGYCDKAYDGMTDASGAQMVKLFGNNMAGFNVLSANNMHLSEHYGNLVTYLRMKNLVPPSSDRPAPPPAKK